MQTELSERASAMLASGVSSGPMSISRSSSYTRGEVIEALDVARCPLFEPFIDYLICFSGRWYDVRGDARVVLPPYPARRHLSLKETIRGGREAQGTGWSLACGEHSTAQSLYEMDEAGVVHFFEAPAHATIEKMIEAHSLMDYLGGGRIDTPWARGLIRADATDMLDEQLSLPRVVEASDDWNTWWMDTETLAHRFLGFGEADRPETLWLFAQTWDELESILLRIRDVFTTTPSLRSWPIRASETDRSAW